MPKIAIDTSPLKSGHQFRGVGIYIKNLIEAFESLNTGKIKIEPIDFKKSDYLLLITHYSLLHYPYFEPFFISLPLRKKIPIIVTVHDLTPLIFPKHFPKGIKGWLKWQIQKLSLRRVEKVITDSESSKRDIVRLVKIPKEKVRVIYLAPGEEFQRLSAHDKQLEAVKKKYKLPEQFILYVGDLNWNKNVEGLIQAFYNIKKGDSFGMTNQKLKMVFIGKAFEDEKLPELVSLKKLIKSLKLEKEVIMLGFLPIEDLVVIYNQATVYCQVSFYEGFGLPVLEALACGCPVVCANMASLPEIVGEAAIFVNPKEPEDIARRISQVLNFNSKNRRKFVEKSLAQAKKFSWQRTVKKTLKVYQEVLHER